MSRPRVCECELREIHGGRFNRCRKGATRQVRVVDTRTLRDVKAGRLTPEPGPWYHYCDRCATEILRRQGATVEEDGPAAAEEDDDRALVIWDEMKASDFANLSDDMIAAAFARHRQADPHCTCNDCIEWAARAPGEEGL